MIGQDKLQQLQIKYGKVVNDLMAEMAEMSLSEKLEWNTPFGSITFKVGDCENELAERICS